MNREIMNIFDEQRNHIGTANRDDVHREGHWHETFHCWFVNEEKGTNFVYFQLRSDVKKDFPSLLDITAAGHLLANEFVFDGIREIKEELGIDVLFNDLISLGIIKDCIVTGEFVDREFAHVFLYKTHDYQFDFQLQKEEVSGVVKANLDDFYEFCLGQKEEIRVEGFMTDEQNTEMFISKNIMKNDFVPHPDSYLIHVARRIKDVI